MAKSDKQNLLEQIRAEIVKDNICLNLAQEATNLVMGHGNPDSEIVFIGEAPGKNEDLEGKPFVGAAGKFLSEMLESAGMKRSDVYITNIVKYRPPNNRDPLPDEKNAFWPYLIREIAVVQPKIVATLGRHSMEYFLPGRSISQIHGEPKRIRIRFRKTGSNGADLLQGDSEKRNKSYKEYDEGASELATKQDAANDSRVTGPGSEQGIMSIVVLPLYHPAAALYNGSMRETLIADFLKVPEIIKLIKSDK